MAEEEPVVVYQCPKCNNYVFKTWHAARKHHQRYGHSVVGIDSSGKVVEEIGKGKPGPKPGRVDLTEVFKKPPITAQGDEHVKQQYKGYATDKERYLFILNPDGTIRDFRLEHPLLYPLYELMKRDRGYQGDFVQFIADGIETLFANAGYELALAPKSQGAMYEEVTRLLQEGKLELAYEGEEMRLGVKEDGNKGQRTEGPTSPGGEGTTRLELTQGRKRKKEKPGESQ